MKRSLGRIGLLVSATLLMGTTCSDHASPSWFRTCGDPVCMANGHRSDPSIPPCEATQTAGATCSTEGARCDPDDPCNVRLVCATEDPTQGTGGCPISRAKYKRDIAYIDDATRERYARELHGLRLATYRYKAAGPEGPEQLGFVIDDVKRGVLVNGDGETVNLYGYTSMAVATLQAQATQIEQLSKQVAALRHEVEELRATRR